MKYYRFFSCAIALILFVGCKNSSTNPGAATYTGTPLSIGGGTLTSWIKTNSDGNLSSIGVTVSDGVLKGLTTDDTMVQLAMPTGFSSAFKSIEVDYSTHDPAPYNHPHIDPHFFFLDMNARMSIMDGRDGMQPMNMTMPSGYMCDSMSEAMMGVHWMDTTAPEYHGQPFQCTFDYGFSKGNMTFLEVMCDKSSLDGHKVINGAVRKPSMMSGMMMSMVLPSTYNVSYDSVAKASTIELDGF